MMPAEAIEISNILEDLHQKSVKKAHGVKLKLIKKLEKNIPNIKPG